ncbi:hypothetical protein EYC84_011582 [Monilinia fructicola]|uniref:Uncharacterized protein n=1 Tax=Monilinia fructicola TaxID=38448 RepID=A0A5M9J785_MONFR|nr:hypothetical protein EYC84_011582 [Monilinia fructicola]
MKEGKGEGKERRRDQARQMCILSQAKASKEAREESTWTGHQPQAGAIQAGKESVSAGHCALAAREQASKRMC